MPITATKWTVPYPLLFADWTGEADPDTPDDDVIVFQAATGNLHLITPAAAIVLQSLADAPLTALQLCRRLPEGGGIREEFRSATLMTQVFLIPFNNIGLVARHDS